MGSKAPSGAFPTKTGGGKSGSEKLAAFKEATSGSGSTQTPSEYRESTASKSSEEIAAGQLITSSGERAAGIDRTQQALAALKQTTPTAPSIRQATTAETQQQYTIPSPVKDVVAWQAAQAAQAEDKTAATGYFYSPITRQYEPTLSTIVSKKIEEETEEAYETLDNKALEKKQLSEYPLIGKYVPEKYASVVPTTAVYQQSQHLATSIRELQDTEVGDFIKISTPGLTAIGGSVVESGARLVEFGGMIPAGVETLATKPEIIKPALIVGGLSSARGIYESVTTEPGQFVSDIGVQAIIGAGVAKGVSPVVKTVKSTLPKVELSSTPQEALIKIKVPEAPKIVTEQPTPITQAEFITSTMGKDAFKITEIQSQVATIPKAETGFNVLVGETKGGLTDVFIKTSPETLQALSKKYTGTVQQIVSKEGSFVSFEPTGEIGKVAFDKTSFGRVETPTFEQIGEIPSITKVGFESPIRLSKRVQLQEATLEAGEGLIGLPEYTELFETRGRVQPEFNMGDYWNIPEVETLALESGIKTYVEPRQSFLASEQAKLIPGRRVTTYKAPEFIGEMPQMNIKAVRQNQPLAKYKEPSSQGIDISQMQKLYDEAVIRGSGKSPRISISRTPTGRTGNFPFAIPLTNIETGIRGELKPSGITKLEGITITVPGTEFVRGFDTVTEPSTKAETTTVSQLIPDTKPSDFKVNAGKTPTLFKLPEIPKQKKEVKKKRSRKTKSKKQAEFTELVNPFASFKDVFGFRK